jgi:hypothetical protein
MEIFDNRNIAMSAYFVVMFVIPRSGYSFLDTKHSNEMNWQET